MDRKHNKELVNSAKELRKNMTKEERRLWYDFLRDYPIKFTRQKVLGKYIADFYCAKANVVIELDGSQHYMDEGLKNDAVRTAYLKQYKIKVIRISNLDVLKNFEGVCMYIDEMVKGTTPQSLCDSSPEGELPKAREAALGRTQGSLWVQLQQTEKYCRGAPGCSPQRKQHKKITPYFQLRSLPQAGSNTIKSR